MRKKIFWAVLIVVCAAAGVYWYNYTRETRTPPSIAINAIPTNAAVIIESKQMNTVWNKISQTNIMWEELLNTETVAKLNRQIHFIDSLIHQQKPVEQLLAGNSVFISAHVSGAYTYDFLYTFGLPAIRDKSTVEDFFYSLNNNKEPLSRNYDGVAISTIYSKNGDSLNYAFLNGVLMMSRSQSLVQAALRQLKSGVSLKADKKIDKILGAAGKNVDANIYINYKNLPAVFDRFVAKSSTKELHAVADFAYFSGWDIGIKPKALTFSGFTQTTDSPFGFLNLFSKQKPQEIKLTKIVPSTTSLLMFWGVSNIKTFHHDYKNYIDYKNHSQSYDEHIEEINKEYHINIEQSMLEWINNEMALVITEGYSNDYADNVYAIFHSGDLDNAFSKLFNLTDTINKKDKTKLDTVSFYDHTIVQLNLPNILPKLFGPSFNKITNSYYCAIDNYIVFGNSKEALKTFINKFESNKTLENDKNYKAFSENIATEAGVYVYSSIPRSLSMYASFVNDELGKDIEKHTELFQKFGAMGIQFTMSNNLIYSNGYVNFNPHNSEQNATLWETKIGAAVSSKPYLVLNHNNNNKEVFVQDDANKVYLISNTGKVNWTKQLDEKIMGDIIQLDIFKNKKLQIIFNTRSAIHALDRNGNEVTGFPIRLKSPATNAIVVFDYENNRNYRILVACESKKILCYEPTGKEVKGFKFDKTNNSVKMPIQFFKANNKEHLCVVDEKGKIYILNRKGETRVKINESLSKVKNFFVETGKDYSKTYIIGADTLGNISKISLTNEKESFKIDDFETVSFFDYYDIAGDDDVKEYIFISGDKLKVYSQNKSLLFEYEFKEAITQPPFIANFTNGEGKIGVVSETTNELFLFNDNGSLYTGFPLEGRTAFSIGDFNNDGNYNLVTGSAFNSIYAYQLSH